MATRAPTATAMTTAGPATPVEEVMARWETDRFQAVLALERPLAGFEVQLTYLEDDPDQAALVMRWLDAGEHAFRHFETGEAFLAAAGELRPELVLLTTPGN